MAQKFLCTRCLLSGSLGAALGFVSTRPGLVTPRCPRPASCPLSVVNHCPDHEAAGPTAPSHLATVGRGSVCSGPRSSPAAGISSHRRTPIPSQTWLSELCVLTPNQL